MRNIQNFEKFLQRLEEEENEKTQTILSAEEVANYMEKITPDESDIPHYFIDKVLQSEKKFVEKKIRIEDVLKMDKDVREYVMTADPRYGHESSETYYEPSEEELEEPIVIFDNYVIDGYSRLRTLYHEGKKEVTAYVSK